MGEKNIFVPVSAIILLTVFVASASMLLRSGKSERITRVSVIVDDSSSQRWEAFYEGLDQAAKDTGIQVTLVPTEEYMTLNQQYKLVNDEISRGADGIILQVTNSRSTENMISDITSRAVLVLIDTDADKDVDVEGRSACIETNNEEIGRALANEVMLAYGDRLNDMSFGVIAGNLKQTAMVERLRGFSENISLSGANLAWIDSDPTDISESLVKWQQNAPADIIVALNNACLEGACDYCQTQEAPPALFGEGISVRNVSCLDNGLISSMIVPNEYYMGYRSLVAISERLDSKLTPMSDEKVSFRVINKDNLFDETNQRILFPVYSRDPVE